ncbi:MAG: hypothetical protein A2020_04390 [Lentisphaerae bacterium GWF2_45_14]|nr:MAG: hypothetical protein A2020_04390 [Lentisphaerae bacterium GWF2_45_14]
MTFIVVVIGFFLRFDDLISRGLEYDEIWTLKHYTSQSLNKIFTDLTTPNNHPLHSFAVKSAFAAFGPGVFALRFDAFLAGMALIGIIAYLARMLLNSRIAAFYSAVLCAFSGALIHYSQTSRGYMLQAFLIAVVAVGIMLYTRNKRVLGPGIVCAASIAAILTLSTSILFIVPIFIVAMLPKLCMKDISGTIRQNIPLITAFGVTALFCVFWYTLNFEQFQAGKKAFGNSPATLFGWGDAIYIIIRDCGSFLVPLSLLMFFDKKLRLFLGAFLFIFLFPFLCAPLTTLGPARAYLPLIPFACIAASGGVLAVQKLIAKRINDRMNRGLFALFAGLLVVSLAFFSGKRELRNWTPLDWARAFPLISDQVPLDAFIAYPAGEGLPIAGNNNNAPSDNIRRVPSEKKEYLFINVINDDISGIDVKDNACLSIKPPASDKVIEYPLNIKGRVYRLIPLAFTGKVFSGITVMALNIVSRDKAYALISELKSRHGWLLLNTFLTPKTVPYKALLISKNPGISRESMLKIEAANPAEILFFSLEPL